MNRISILIERFDEQENITVIDELITHGAKCTITYLYPEVVRDYLGNICTRPQLFEIKKRVTLTGVQQEPNISATDNIRVLIEHQKEIDFYKEMIIKEFPVIIANQHLKISASGEFTWEIVLEEK